ncbi:hypothetical protein EJB05_50466, partial [Eragrostis curvula]
MKEYVPNIRLSVKLNAWPDDEPWPGHLYDQPSPTGLNLLDEWAGSLLHLGFYSDPPAVHGDATQPTSDGTGSGLDSDAEATALPPNLLDSPPRDSDDDPDMAAPPTAPIDNFLHDMAAPPPTPALPLPLQPPLPVWADTLEEAQQRKSKRIARQPPPTSANPAERASTTQLKKWVKTAGKKTCLDAYKGLHKEDAQDAFADLLASAAAKEAA